MIYKKETYTAWFTLIELLIVITLIWVIFTSVRYINFNEVNNRKRAEIFTNEVARVFICMGRLWWCRLYLSGRFSSIYQLCELW